MVEQKTSWPLEIIPATRSAGLTSSHSLRARNFRESDRDTCGFNRASIGITCDKNCDPDPDKGANHHTASHADFDSDAGPFVNPHTYPNCDMSRHTG